MAAAEAAGECSQANRQNWLFSQDCSAGKGFVVVAAAAFCGRSQSGTTLGFPESSKKCAAVSRYCPENSE